MEFTHFLRHFSSSPASAESVFGFLKLTCYIQACWRQRRKTKVMFSADTTTMTSCKWQRVKSGGRCSPIGLAS